MDSDYDCQLNGEVCAHCQMHMLELLALFGYTDGPALKYRKDTYPVVFNCQFIYRYNEINPNEYVQDLQQKVSDTLYSHFNQKVHVFSYHEIDEVDRDPPRKVGRAKSPSMWISLLIDFPKYVKVGNSLFKSLFEDRTPSLDDWEMCKFEATDHMSLARLEWFMDRAGYTHAHNCVEGAYQLVLNIMHPLNQLSLDR